MFLKLDNTKNMKVVYRLSEELKANPKLINLAQTLTLNTSKPNSGLKGTNGLYGSSEWWSSIEQGRIPLKYTVGKIVQTYVAGQDFSPINNGFTLLTENDSICEEAIPRQAKEEDKKLFKVGAIVKIIYAQDERKRLTITGEKDHLDILLEMAVSLDTVPSND